MSGPKLARIAPTLILVVFVGYALFSMESGTPEAVQKEAEIEKGLDRMVKDVLAEGASAAKKLEGKMRDPFWAPPPPPKAQEDGAKRPEAPPERDRIAEIVDGMTLEATFLQGRDQLAVIDGRIYSRGQEIPIDADNTSSGRSLLVVSITRTGVLLRGENKHYNLGYPERLGRKKEADEGASADSQVMTEIDPGGQLEMFQRLLNSPLGAMGRGLLGNSLLRGSLASPATSSGGRGGPGKRPRGSGIGGP